MEDAFFISFERSEETSLSASTFSTKLVDNSNASIVHTAKVASLTPNESNNSLPILFHRTSPIFSS